MDKRLGVYIHIPFCASKCAYCDFYSVAGRERLMPEYQNALIAHIKEYSAQLSGYYIDSVYFGGGTPSFYGADRLIGVFTALKKYGNVLLDSEVTAEVNPDSVSRQELARMHRAGFNRVSIGMQSHSDKMLKSIGRRHDIARVEEAVIDARAAGFKNVSLDIIYGLPSQSREDWAATVAKAVALKPDHISCYGLKLEKGTPLYIFKDSPFLPDDDTQADMYLYAVDALSRYGYRQYEISNFARRGFESRHNLKYWRCEEYIGFGPAAHSYIGSRRYSNISDVEKYCEGIAAGSSVVDSSELIYENERASEYLMLGLRTTMGISRGEYAELFPYGMALIEKRLEEYREHGWASFDNDRWSFTPEGFLLSNTLIGELLELQTEQRAAAVKPWRPESEAGMQLSMHTEEKRESSVFRGI